MLVSCGCRDTTSTSVAGLVPMAQVWRLDASEREIELPPCRCSLFQPMSSVGNQFT